MRAIVSASLSLFVIWNLEILAPEDLLPSSRPLRFGIARYEGVILALSLVALLVFNFYILPESFKAGLVERHSKIPFTFRQIMVPYFPYLIYAFCFWIGIMLPAFLFLLRRALIDLIWWRQARARLYGSLSRQITLDELTISTFQELLASFQGYVIGLKNVAERYLPVLLAMSLGLLHEQLTSVYQTVTPTAVEAAKAASWLFLGPALIIFVTLVALGYQSAVKKAEAGFSPYIDLLVKSPEKVDVLSAFLVLRTNFLWQQSPLTFVLTAVKSASVSIPLLLTLTAYILKSVLDKTPWPALFLPNSVVEVFRSFYR